MAAERRGFQDKFTDFKINDFNEHDQVAIFVNGAWQVAELASQPELSGNGKLSVEIVGAPGSIELGVPPKKIELPPPATGGGPSTVEIDGQTYTYDPQRAPIVLDADGDVVFDLQNTTGGRPGKERLGVKAEILRNLSKIKEMGQTVQKLQTEITRVAGMRRKELLETHTKLAKRVKDLMLEFGSPVDWENWNGQEVELVGRKLEETRREIVAATSQLKSDMEEVKRGYSGAARNNLEAELGTLHAEDLAKAEVRELKKQEKRAQTDFEAVQEPWKKQKVWWDEYNQMGKGKGGNKKTEWEAKYGTSVPVPSNPGIEPVKKSVDTVAAVEKSQWEFFNRLDPADELRIEVEKRRKEKAAIRKIAAGDFPAGDPAGTDQQKADAEIFQAETIELMKKVIEEWKKKSVEKFDFGPEKISLENKLKELYDRIEKYPPAEDLENRIGKCHEFLRKATADTKNIEKKLLGIWKICGEIELAVYQKEISAQNKPEIEEGNIDLPQELLMRIFAGRKNQVQDLMEHIYNHSLTTSGVNAEAAIRGALNNLFETAPDRGLLLELKKYGISSWDSFKELLGGKFGEQLIEVLNVMAQGHLTTEITRNTYWHHKDMGRVRKVVEGLKRSKFWSIKGIMAAKMLTSVAVVGGTTLALAATVSTGGALAAVGTLVGGTGVLLAGGTVGGFLRGLLNKTAFGSKAAKEHMSQQIDNLNQTRKKEFVDQTMESDFGDVGGVDQFAARTNAKFSAIMAQCLREANKETEALKNEPKEAKNLSANARRIYKDSMRRFEMTGKEIKETEKQAFVLALLELQPKTEEIVKKAAKGADKKELRSLSQDLKDLWSKTMDSKSDPVFITLITGAMQSYSGNSKEHAILFSTVLGAGMSLALGCGNPYAAAGMGAAGGALVGYQGGEAIRKERETKKGEKELREDLAGAIKSFADYKAGLAGRAPRMTPEAKEEFAELIMKFKWALKGGRQFETGEEGSKKKKEEVEQWYVLALEGDPVSRKQLLNLIYEAEKAGIFVEQEIKNNLEISLERLAQRKTEIIEQCKTKVGERLKNWSWRNLERVGWTVAGAIGGGFLAWGMGEGIKELREVWQGHGSVSEVGAGAAVVEEAARHQGGGGAGQPDVHDVHPPVKGGGGGELPHPAKSGGVPEQVHQPTHPKAAATVDQPKVEHPVGHKAAGAVAAEAVSGSETHPGGGLDFHNEHNPDVIRFSAEHNLTDKEFAYLQRLTDKYPQLNNPESLNKIIHSAEFTDGKACAHPEIYKGTINTPIESAADAKLTTLDGILKGGKGTADGVEFLKQQNFNAHSLENLGIKGLPKVGSSGYESALEQKLTQLVEQYQGGNKGAGKHLFDAFRHDMNRAQAPFMTEVKPGVEVLPVKGLKGMNPRVWGTDEDGEVLVGQAKGYTPRVSPTMAEKLEHDVYHTEKVNPTHEIKNLTPEQEAANNKMFHDVMRNPNKVISNLPQEVEARFGPNARITEVVPAPSRGSDAALIKTDNGEWHAVRIHEAEVPVGLAGKSGAMETVYEISALEPVSDAVASQLGVGHGAGATAVGLEAVPVHPKAGLDFSHPKFDPNSTEVKAAMASASRHGGGGGGGAPKLETTAGGAPKLDTQVPQGSKAELPHPATGKELPVEPKPDVKVQETTTKPVVESTPKPEVAEPMPVGVEAKYGQAIDEVSERWDYEINKMSVSGELTKGKLLDELHRYLGNAEVSHTGLNQSEVAGDFNSMVDNTDVRLRGNLPPALDFILNEHPQGDNPLVFAPDGQESDMIKFLHEGKEYLLQDPENMFKMDNGQLLVENEDGNFVPAMWGVDNDGNPVVTPAEDVKMAANQ